MKSKVNLSFIIFIIFLIFGFTVRVYRIGDIPPGFFADEASIGYNAYTLLTSGKDETGNKFPVFFRNFNDFYRPGLSVYFSALYVSVFGLKEFSIRLASVVIGTLTIIAIYYLGKLLFSSEKVGLLSAILLAISPWHIHFSRIGQEFVYLVFFLILSVDFFLIGIAKKKPFFLILGFLFFGLTLYTYVPAFFLVPLFILLLGFPYFRDLSHYKKVIFAGLIVFILIAQPLILGLNNKKTLSRFKQLKVTYNYKSNKEILKGMIITYKDHFMPEFLFQKGDIGYHSHFITRFSVKGMGQLYWFQLPFIIIGLLTIWKRKKSPFFLLGWLILYPLPSTLVPFADGGGPFASRSIVGVIPFQILSAVGLNSFFSFLKNKVLKILFVSILLAVIIFSFFFYLKKYFTDYPLYSSDYWGWQYGPKEIITYFEKVHNQYDELYMSGAFNAPYIFIRFYSPKNCHKCEIGDLGKLNLSRRQLFALGPEEININFSRIIIHKVINYPNQKKAFFIFEVKN